MAQEPTLPAVPLPAAVAASAALGPAARRGPGRAPVPWPLRLRDLLVAYLPLLLMLLLALATWWLVKNTPSSPPAQGPAAVRHEPDYTMNRFALERFGADGQLKLRLEGAQLRHFPDVDRIEVDAAQIRATAPDGRVLLASASRAISNGDASEVQLIGRAQVTGTDATGAPLEIRSDFLHAWLVTERVRTHLPVQVRSGTTELQAAGLDYDHAERRLDLRGPMRAVFPPRAARAAQAPGKAVP